MAEAVRTKSCPICGKPQDPRLRPFCSRRCADVDLNRWLTGAYAIPAAEQDDTQTEAPQAEDGSER
jgi:uncharacterized protein